MTQYVGQKMIKLVIFSLLIFNTNNDIINKLNLFQHLMKFLNEATHGVILFSLGTLTNSYTLSSEIIAALKTTFAKIPQRVIWKHDDVIEGISDNVLLSSWVPQKEILGMFIRFHS